MNLPAPYGPLPAPYAKLWALLSADVAFIEGNGEGSAAMVYVYGDYREQVGVRVIRQEDIHHVYATWREHGEAGVDAWAVDVAR